MSSAMFVNFTLGETFSLGDQSTKLPLLFVLNHLVNEHKWRRLSHFIEVIDDANIASFPMVVKFKQIGTIGDIPLDKAWDKLKRHSSKMAAVKDIQTYKFRAECLADSSSFLNEIIISGLHYRLWTVIPDRSQHKFQDVDVIFSSSASLDQLRRAAMAVSDGHVMVESLNVKKKYTGDRYYKSTDEDDAYMASVRDAKKRKLAE